MYCMIYDLYAIVACASCVKFTATLEKVSDAILALQYIGRMRYCDFSLCTTVIVIFCLPELPARPTFQLTKVLAHPPVHSEFVSATSSDGARVYMRLRSIEKVTGVRESNVVFFVTMQEAVHDCQQGRECA